MNKRNIKNSFLWQKWKDVPEFEGLYRCSTLGVLKTLPFKKQNNNRHYEIKGRKERFIGSINKKTGYIQCALYGNGKQYNSYIHVIVAKTFLNYKRDDNMLVINHKDENKTNNKLKNLEICTQSTNVKSCFNNGRIIHNKGSVGKISTTFKMVYQYDLNRNFIAEYNGSGDAERKTGVDAALIRLNMTGKSKTAHGFIFSRTKF